MGEVGSQSVRDLEDDVTLGPLELSGPLGPLDTVDGIPHLSSILARRPAVILLGNLHPLPIPALRRIRVHERDERFVATELW